MLIEEDIISGDYPVLLKLANGDLKIVRLKVGGKMIDGIRLGKIRIPGMLFCNLCFTDD